MKSNYELVLEIIKSYDDEDILNDFKSRFIVNENVSKEDYFKFSEEYSNDSGDYYYISLNWDYIESGGDGGVFNK
jgi:hypothetical protein